MDKKTEIVTTLTEAAVVAACLGLGGAALPLAAAAYGVWRFVPKSLINRAAPKDDGE